MRNLALLAALGLGACSPEPRTVEADLAIVDVTVATLLTEPLQTDRTVLVRDGRIAEIVASADVRPSPETRVIDGTGRFLIPGLVDAHAHLRAAGTLDLYLSHGFTTVRNMHGGFGDPLVWRRSIEAGTLRGPNLLNASPILAWDNPGRTLPGWGPIDSYDLIKQAIDEIADSGFVSVKTLEFPREAFDTLMVAARRRGLPVTGHPPMTDSGDPEMDLTFDEMLSSGMTIIEHLDELINTGLDPSMRDSASAQDVVDRVAASGVAVTTLTGATRLIAAGLELDSAFVTPELYARALKYGGEEEAEFLYQLPDLWRDNGFIAIDGEFLKMFIRMLHRAGVPILVGTDAHSSMAVAGLAAIEEVRFLHDAGLSNFQALAAATSVPATTLGFAGQWGTIEVGSQADLLLLSSNPLVDLDALEELEGLALDGVWFERAALEEMRVAAEAKVLFCRAPRCE